MPTQPLGVRSDISLKKKTLTGAPKTQKLGIVLQQYYASTTSTTIVLQEKKKIDEEKKNCEGKRKIAKEKRKIVEGKKKIAKEKKEIVKEKEKRRRKREKGRGKRGTHWRDVFFFFLIRIKESFFQGEHLFNGGKPFAKVVGGISRPDRG